MKSLANSGHTGRNLAVLASAAVLFIGGCTSRPPASDPSEQVLGAESTAHRSGTASGTAEEAAKADLRSGHERMVDLLDEIRRDAMDNHPFVGQRRLREAQQVLKMYGDRVSPLDRSTMHGMLGQELLRAGRTSEAIEHTLIAVGLLDEHQDQIPAEVRQRAYYLLAVAYLRDGEDRNCVHCINGERCLFPVRGLGIHEQTDPSRQAAQYLEKALELDPEDLGARWLLNIAYMTLGEYPDKVPEAYRIPPERFQLDASPIGEFRNIARELGLNVMGCAGGTIADDFDGDNDLDLLFSSWLPDGELRYFRNEGDGTFTDQTELANLKGIVGGLNLVQADYDNDGDLDVLVLRGAWLEQGGRYPNSLLRNDGTGRFEDVTFEAGLGEVHYPTQTASWADYDLDGDLDLFIGNEGFPAQLFQNDGKGHFVDVAQKAGVAERALTKGVAWGDYDQDGWPDIYVSNLPGTNRLYRNLGNGRFRDVAREAGVTGPFHSFPCWFWDFNNDGVLDLFVSSYQPGLPDVARDYLGLPIESEPDAIYRGSSAGTFDDVTQEIGFTRVTQPMGVNFGDIDNDGFLDFYLGTGFVDYEGLIPNLLFRNDRGKRFQDITFSARVGHLQKGHGVAMADLDHDGDLDIIASMGGWFAGDAFAKTLFENPGSSGHWLQIRLVGKATNRFGIGCRVRAVLDAGGERSIYRWMNSGGSFGANPLRMHLGLGDNEVIPRLEIEWPASKTRQIFENVAANQFLEITEGEAEYRVLPVAAMPFRPQDISEEAPPASLTEAE